MTQSFVTQCPHCRTSFRVSSAQLNAAHGAVRCGACLHVFNAAQQLREQGLIPPQAAPIPTKAVPPAQSNPIASPPVQVQSPAPLAKQEETPAPTQPARADKDDTLWIHDDLDLGDLDLDEELAKLQAEEQDLSKEFLALDRPTIAAKRKEETPSDERWAEELLKKEEANAARSTPIAPPEQIEPALTIGTETLEKHEPSIGKLDELDPGPNELELPPLDGKGETPALSLQSEPELPPTAAKRQRTPRLTEERLIELDDEPLQLNWQKPKKPWGRWFGWGLLNLFAALGLAVQYVAYNFEELSRQDQYRPWFEQFCPTIGCTLPSKVDIDQIKSSNLVVRSHPEFSGALVVDAIIYNRASFSQPFPLLEMRFADVNGKLLASRRFKPSEYLAGELAGNSEMPPQTPIHISLDILDPGARAVNYSLSFHSPE
ncbi:DUF3426 domain-containing protein [Ectopseudomonas mendocina]|uniref:DUF3426 domain-containing protein n=1 Tax=Ectopseudomonas mendocina TaxID=300 RepID=A0ABZ2RDR2_ECTME